MKNTFPLVSIITPSFNQGLFLEETIKSVINQDYSNIEYLIIDGGSTDESVNIINKYEDHVNYWISEPDNGQSHAINKGIIRAQGDILGWINSDDTLEPTAIKTIVRFLTKHPEIDVVYGKANRIDEHGQIIPGIGINRKVPVFSKKYTIGECIVTQPGSFWRRWVTDQIGLLNENLNYAMDQYYWIRMALAGANFGYVADKTLANFRLSKNSKTVSKFDLSGHENLEILNDLLSDPELSIKIGIHPVLINLRARRAKALACMKISKAHSQRKGEGRQAFEWLGKSIKYYPPIILIRYRSILWSFQSIFRVNFRN